MNYSVSKEHLDFFYHHRFIEFEDLLSTEEADLLKKNLDESIAKRLNLSPNDLIDLSPFETYKAGRDLFRDNPTIKKFSLKRKFAEITSQLMKKKPIRIAYDQALYSPATHYPQSNLPKLFSEDVTLAEISCFQGLVCGLILCLNETRPSQNINASVDKTLPTLLPIAQKKGNGVFFKPDTPLSLFQLFQETYQNHLLIAFGEDNLVYKLQSNDPNSHTLKNEGYVFGDKLNASTHPLIFR